MAIRASDFTRQTLGFFSMCLSWITTNVLYSFYLVGLEGYAVDMGVIFFWSGLLMGLAWLIFMVIPIKLLLPSSVIFRRWCFPFITMAYGSLVYGIIVMSLFREFGVVKLFIVPAAAAGFLFGLFYSNMLHAEKWVQSIEHRFWIKTSLWLSPIILCFLLLRILPFFFPSAVFRFVPDELREEIIRETIPQYRAGDNFEGLSTALPGYFDDIRNGEGNMMATMEDFAFVIEVHCYTISRLEYSSDPAAFDHSMGAMDRAAPCP